MKSQLQILVFLLTTTLLISCNWLFNSPDDTSQEGIGKFDSGDYGTVSTETGESLQIIPGTIPADTEGNQASVTFTIETDVEAPERLEDGASFQGDLVKFGPENFNFRWPVQLSLPYKEGQDPNQLSVMFYDFNLERWLVVPKAGIDGEKRLIYFNSLNLGVFGLAELSSDYRFEWSDGGFRYTDQSQSYFYTLTVAQVTNYKYPYQATWSTPFGTGRLSGSTGVRNNQPLKDTWLFLVQADYQIWISRTKPGTLSTLPTIETYSIPAKGSLTEPCTCPQSATTFPDLNHCDPWVQLTLQGGGSWIPGTPDNWPVPTKTYGTGDFQATLNWVNNESHATDLDLHLYGPDGLHVYYEADISADGSVKLDRDWWEDFGNATENIYSLKEMPKGNYQLKVVLFNGDPANFNVRVIRSGEIKNYSGKLTHMDEEVLVDEFSL